MTGGYIFAFILYIMIIYIVLTQVADIFISLVIIAVIGGLLYGFKYYYQVTQNVENFADDQITAGQRGLVYGDLIPNDNEPSQNINQLIVYSGDIIDISKPLSNSKFSLMTDQNLIYLSNQFNENLKKMRILVADPNTQINPYKLYPIRYGDPIKFQFTIGRIHDYYLLINGNRLTSNCQKFSVFKLIDPINPNNRSAVQTLDDVVIQSDDLKYLSLDNNQTIIQVEDPSLASHFNLSQTNQCNSNWRLDYSDPQNKLISRSDANRILELYNQDILKQISDIEKDKQQMQINCNNQLNTILNDRKNILNQLKK